MEKASITLEIYEGPLDLLLSLISKNEIDIYNIPITEITAQYIKYIYQLNAFDIDIASEFIVMASTLIEIKSKMMLPPDGDEETEDEFDPREELVRRLVEYKLFKMIAEDVIRPNEDDFLRTAAKDPGYDPRLASPEKIVNMDAAKLAKSMQNLLIRHQISLDAVKNFYSIDAGILSVEEMIERLSGHLDEEPSFPFKSLFSGTGRKSDVIAAFLAVLELFKRDLVQVNQPDIFGDILITKNEVWSV